MIPTLLLTLALGTGGGVKVHLPAQAEVTGAEFALGDVARVEGDDEAAAQRLRSLLLGYAPAPGYSRLLEAEALLREATTSFPGVEISFEGAATCRVSSKVQRIEAAAIGALAKAELARLFRGQDVALEMHGQLQDLSVPEGQTPATLRARLREQGARPGSWSVPVEVLVDGAVARTVWTSWNVDLWQQREVLVRDVPRGGRLTPQDVELQRVRVQQPGPGQAVDRAVLRGAVARRDMRAGEVVDLTDIEREIVIRRGDMVHVEVSKGAITARGAGIAQEDGRIGDRVRVLMSSTDTEVSAVAAGKERVEIRMN